MTRVRGLTKIGYEEKGQRTTRNTDSYIPKEGMKEVAKCTECKALYWNKRWYPDENESMQLRLDMVKNEVLCPACQRIRDKNPAGVVTMTGEYLDKHESDILNAISNIEETARMKNPLSRIMETKQEEGTITILTTDSKLAQKIGRSIYKSHSGKLEYQWSREDSFVRVNWSR